MTATEHSHTHTLTRSRRRRWRRRASRGRPGAPARRANWKPVLDARPRGAASLLICNAAEVRAHVGRTDGRQVDALVRERPSRFACRRRRSGVFALTETTPHLPKTRRETAMFEPLLAVALGNVARLDERVSALRQKCSDRAPRRAEARTELLEVLELRECVKDHILMMTGVVPTKIAEPTTELLIREVECLLRDAELYRGDETLKLCRAFQTLSRCCRDSHRFTHAESVRVSRLSDSVTRRMRSSYEIATRVHSQRRPLLPSKMHS